MTVPDATALSRVGLGAWAFGRTGWGTQDDEDSRAAILRAVELGLTWIDTAAVYGDGHSESVVGKTLSELAESERPLLFTKGGLRVDPTTGGTVRDLHPGSLRDDCEQSLRRLRVERIDLYQIHWPTDDPWEVAAAWETLGELQAQGKIRWAGVSNFDIPLLERCAAIRTVGAAQVPFSLLSRRAAEELLAWTAERGVRLFAYSPLESGLLSGRFSMRRLRSLPENDWRRRRPRFQHPSIDRTVDLIARLDPVAADLGVSLAELAIAWTLRWGAVDGVVVGARDAAQVDGWIGASRLTLETSVLDEIETVLLETEAGEGPTHPDGHR